MKGGSMSSKDIQREEMKQQQQRWLQQMQSAQSAGGGVFQQQPMKTATPPGTYGSIPPPTQSTTPPHNPMGAHRNSFTSSVGGGSSAPSTPGAPRCGRCQCVFRGDSECLPMLLAPCGHTLCSPCTSSQVSTAVFPPVKPRRGNGPAEPPQSQSRNQCPVCQQEVISIAVNQALVGMIQQMKESLYSGMQSPVTMTPSLGSTIGTQGSVVGLPPQGGDASLPLSVLQVVKGNPQGEQYARKYFAARRKWKTMSEELSMARAEMGEWGNNLRTHEGVVHALSHELTEMQQRLIALTQECQIVSAQLQDERQRYANISEQMAAGQQRVQTLNGSVDTVGTEMSRARLILCEICPGITPMMLE
eukprot:PhF_6_TR3665/c0_g1_i1/m.5167